MQDEQCIELSPICDLSPFHGRIPFVIPFAVSEAAFIACTMSWQENLRLARVKLTYQALEPVRSEPYLGAVLHGALGRAAESVSPEWARQLYPVRTKSAPRDSPNPFNLSVPAPGRVAITPGEEFSFSITLFGQLADEAEKMLLTAMALARNGLGERRNRIALTGLLETYPDETDRVIVSDGVVVAPFSERSFSAANLPCRGSGESKVRIDFLTPCELIENDVACRRAPPFSLLVRRFSGRVSMICSELCATPLPWGQRETWIRAAAGFELTDDQTRYDRFIERYRHGTKPRQFGGIVGDAIYRGPVDSIIGLLELAAWLGVGKKTSYGFGSVHCYPNQLHMKDVKHDLACRQC